MLRLAAIVPPDWERLEAMAERLKLSTVERKYLEDFASFPIIRDEWSGPQFDALLYQHGASGAETRLKLALSHSSLKAQGDVNELERVARLVALLDRVMSWIKPVLPVKGADLLRAGFVAGPEIGEKLAALEALWLESNFKLSQDELLAKLKH